MEKEIGPQKEKGKETRKVKDGVTKANAGTVGK